MSNLVYLLKLHGMQWFGINKVLHSHDKKERRKLLGFGLLMLLVGILLIGMVVSYSLLMAALFGPAGAMRLLPMAMMAVVSLLTLFLSLYKAGSILFGFGDMDMILALPIRTGVVVASRLLILYGMNLGATLLVMLPSGIVYAVLAAPQPLFYLAYPLTLVTMPLVPTVAAAVVGTAITAVASRFRRTNVLSILLMLGLVALLLVGSFQLNAVIPDLTDITASLLASLNRIYPLTGLYGRAVCDGNIPALLLFTGSSLLVAVAFSLVVGRFYRRLGSRLKAEATGAKYTLTALKFSSPFLTLCKRELRRFFSSTLYVVNAGCGLFLLLLASVASLFAGTGWLEQLGIPGGPAIIRAVLPFGMGLLVSMVSMTSCSISLEGTQLWLVKSLPVSARTVLLSKAAASLALQIPVIVVSALLFAVSLSLSPLQLFYATVIPSGYAFVASLGGLWLNMAFPNFTWTSEAAVIKQSPATMINVMGGMLLSLLPCVGAVALEGAPWASWFPAAVLLLIAAASAGLYLWLRTSGARKFALLS